MRKLIDTTNTSGTSLVTVLINCYNGMPYLKQCLDSVFAQTHSNFEIVFVDNQSTDGSAELAQSYGPKLRYFKTPHLMQLYDARNFGIGQAKGEAVAFVDADDYWAPTKLEQQLCLLENVGIVYTRVQFIDADGTYNHNYPIPTYYRGANLTGRLLQRNFISMSSAMVRMDLIRQYPFDPYYLLLGDFDLWARLTQVTAVDYVDEKLSFYRVYPENTSHKNWKRMPEERRHFYLNFMKQFGAFKIPEIIGYAVKAECRAALEQLKALVHNQ